jgi:hypothetical protein
MAHKLICRACAPSQTAETPARYIDLPSLETWKKVVYPKGRSDPSRKSGPKQRYSQKLFIIS